MANSCKSGEFGLWIQEAIYRDNESGIYFCFLIIITAVLSLCLTLLNLLVELISVIKTDQDHNSISFNMTEFEGSSFILNI